eukprot:Hpha_TRINITY_DN26925_c0_g1::TRINITY_DN26925_c0_g1_i1::g.24783::m.24783
MRGADAVAAVCGRTALRSNFDTIAARWRRAELCLSPHEYCKVLSSLRGSFPTASRLLGVATSKTRSMPPDRSIPGRDLGGAFAALQRAPLSSAIPAFGLLMGWLEYWEGPVEAGELCEALGV